MKRQRKIRRQRVAQSYLWSFDYLHMRPLLATLFRSRTFVRGIVLDLGCGNRPYQSWFSEATTYIGLDMDPVNGQPDVVAIGECLPFAANSFDSVFSAQTLEHVPDPFAVMTEIARVLKPGGHLVLTAPQAWRVHERPHDYFRFTCYGLRYLAERHGLEVIRIQAQGGIWALVGQTILNTVPHKELRHITAPFNLVFNLFFLLLDALWHDEQDTLNYLLVARKPT